MCWEQTLATRISTHFDKDTEAYYLWVTELCLLQKWVFHLALKAHPLAWNYPNQTSQHSALRCKALATHPCNKSQPDTTGAETFQRLQIPIWNWTYCSPTDSPAFLRLAFLWNNTNTMRAEHPAWKSSFVSLSWAEHCSVSGWVWRALLWAYNSPRAACHSVSRITSQTAALPLRCPHWGSVLMQIRTSEMHRSPELFVGELCLQSRLWLVTPLLSAVQILLGDEEPICCYHFTINDTVLWL